MTVEWSERATGMLQAARDFLARSSPAYAQTVAARIVRRAEALADNPKIGAVVEEYADEALREIYEHPYRILYRVTNPVIQVVAVVHSARRLPTTPPG